MSSYADFARQAPELAAAVRARFEAHLHHVMGTLRADGSPRLSGTEARFFEGELYLGSMPGARKAADLLRSVAHNLGRAGQMQADEDNACADHLERRDRLA